MNRNGNRAIMPDKTEKKQGKFQKGTSGNPLGRPRGIRNKATIAAEALFEGEIEGICRKAIEEAKARKYPSNQACAGSHSST